MHHIIHKKLPIILSHTLHIRLISQHTPLFKNLQITSFYLVFVLREDNDPFNTLTLKSGIVFLMKLKFYVMRNSNPPINFIFYPDMYYTRTSGLLIIEFLVLFKTLFFTLFFFLHDILILNYSQYCHT